MASRHRSDSIDSSSRALTHAIRGASPLVVFATVAAPLFLIFFITADRTLPFDQDPFANVFTAWSLATDGDVYLDEFDKVTGPEFFADVNQLMRGRGRPVSKYPPGAALLAAPLYLLDRDAPTQKVP